MKECLLGIFFLVCAVSVRPAAAKYAEVTKIEQECVAYCRAINSAHLVIDIKLRTRDSFGREIEVNRDCEIWFQPGKTRCNLRTDVNWLGDEPSQIRYIITPTEVISQRVSLPAADKNFAVNITDLPEKVANGGMFAKESFRLYNSPSHLHYGYGPYIGQAKRTETKVSREKLREQDCTVVEYKRVDGLRVRTVFLGEDPRYVTRIESRWTSKYTSEELLERFDCEYAEPREGDVVFPQKVYFIEQLAGKTRYEQTHTVKLSKFNQEIDASQFTLATMSLPPGTKIHRPKGLVSVWDGVKETTPKQIEQAGSSRSGMTGE